MKTFKLLILFLGAFGLAFSLQAQTTVNFSVDLSLTKWVHPEGVFLAGSFNGWTDEAMDDSDGDGIYTLSKTLTSGMYQFKFKNGPEGWEYFGGNHPNLPYGCVTGPENNRFLDVGDVEMNVHYCFNLCMDCSELTDYVGNYDPIVAVNSPQDIFGLYDFSEALSGPNLNTGIWTADAVFVDDGTDNPTLGCQEPINTAELNGKIALIDRGACAFYYKLLNIQTTGAIAVVMFNNVPGEGPFEINAGIGNPIVTVPVVGLSYEDGQIIREALANGPVNMTIGNYQFPNDIAIDEYSVINASLGAILFGQVTADNFNFVPGAEVTNKGLNDASNVTVTATIEHEASGGATTTVYEESGTISLLETGSAGFVELSPYLPDAGEGAYYVSYEISSDNPNDVPSNNLQNSKFIVSDGVYCKGGWDAVNEHPEMTNAYTIAGGGSIEFIAGFAVPKGIDHELRLTGIQFFMSTGFNGPSFGTIGLDKINGYIYDWADANGDGKFNNDELEIVGIAPMDDVDPSVNEAWVTATIYDAENSSEYYVVPGNDKKYLVGIRYDGPEWVFFGFDENYDQTAFVEHQYSTDLDLPHFVVTSWDNGLPLVDDGFTFLDFYAPVGIALTVEGVASSQKTNPTITSISLFPNPATDFLRVQTTGEIPMQQVTIQVYNMLGELALRFEYNNPDFANGLQLSVSELENGFYILKIDNGERLMSEKFLKMKE